MKVQEQTRYCVGVWTGLTFSSFDRESGMALDDDSCFGRVEAEGFRKIRLIE